MLVRRLLHLVSPLILAVAFVAFIGVAGGSVAKAQGRYCDYNQRLHQLREREALRRHQLRERYQYDNSYALRNHQQREWEDLRRHQRFERLRYYNGYGRYPYYRSRY